MTKREVNLVVSALKHCGAHTESDAEAETVGWVAATLGSVLWKCSAISLDDQARLEKGTRQA